MQPAPPLPSPPGDAADGAASPPRVAALSWRIVRRAVALGLVALVAWTAAQTARGVRASLAAADHAADAARAALERVPLLTDTDLALLRRSLNPRHVALAESLGIVPFDTLGTATTGLVRADTLAAVRVLDGTYSDPLLTPDAARALARVGTTLARDAEQAGVPPARPVATSLLRSAASQAALRRVNANAAAGRSSHEYGTTFDLSYRRFEALPAAARVSPVVPRPFRRLAASLVRERADAHAARLVAEYPARYDALLGRALIRLEDAGAVVALRERNQTVYHVTAAR